MDIDTFKTKVDEIISSGIEYIDLTPVIGEVLYIKNLSEYLDYLDNRDEIKRYTFITSLISGEDNIKCIARRPKLKIEISVYGVTEHSYSARTNRKNAFNTFFNNFKTLVMNHHNPRDIVVINRTNEDLGPILKQSMRRGLKFLLSLCTIDDDNSSDRPNKLIDTGDDPSLCYYMQEPLMTEKGICFCCMDWNQKYTTDKSIVEMYDNTDQVFLQNVKNISPVCNSKCGWFAPPVERDMMLYEKSLIDRDESSDNRSD